MIRKLRRNDIVHERDSDWIMYGRVWRRIDENHVQVIDCGAMVRIYHESDLVLSDYKGTWKFGYHPGNSYGRTPRWVPMTSLKNLKKYARDYNAHFGGRRFTGYKWTKQQQKIALMDRTIYNKG